MKNNMADSDPVQAIVQTIKKINDFLQYQDPDRFVELIDSSISGELFHKYGRQHMVDAAAELYQRGPERPALPELSAKFTNLLREFNARYFQSELFDGVEVRVVVNVDFFRQSEDPGPDSSIDIPVSSEPVMVKRLLYEMVQWNVGCDCENCFLAERDRVLEAGAPMIVRPHHKDLSAEEFIETATRTPREVETDQARTRLVVLKPVSKLVN